MKPNIRERCNEYRTTIVCIDSCENGVLSGRFYNSFLPDGVRFSSLMQFLQQMEKTLDSMDFPQSYTITRSFAPPPDNLPSSQLAEPGSCTGAKATFALRILFRQNSSWQGSVAWLEGRSEQSFRSALELVFLMDSALSA